MHANSLSAPPSYGALLSFAVTELVLDLGVSLWEGSRIGVALSDIGLMGLLAAMLLRKRPD